MKRRRGETFKPKVRLPKDANIRFRYRLDGREWDNDEAADAYWPTDVGGDNPVVSTVVWISSGSHPELGWTFLEEGGDAFGVIG